MNTRIALLGQPNSGKSTVYNALTGSRQHVGNWPGKTVEKNEGYYSYKGKKYTVTDLPGSYGLTGNSDEEVITEDFIQSDNADLICVLVDASQLERSMFMAAEFALLGKPAVLLLNMMDVAKAQKKSIDSELLSERLGIPVLPFTAAESRNYGKLKELLAQELEHPHIMTSAPDIKGDATADSIKADSEAKYAWIRKMLDGVTHSEKKEFRLSKFDRVATAPFWGKLISVGVILLAFLVAMCICIPFMGIGGMLPGLMGKPIADTLTGWHVHPWLVSVFSLIIPNTLYFSMSMASFVLGVNIVFGFLEEIGFLARAAYQFDGVLSKLGLQGKAICPVLMGFGCTIGGTCGTRVMDNWGQRMLAMAVVWAVPCGAIWSVIPVISSMFFAPLETMLICIGILLYMMVMMWIVSRVFGRKLSPKETPQRYDHGAASLSQGALGTYPEGILPQSVGYFQKSAEHCCPCFAAFLGVLLQHDGKNRGQPSVSGRHLY